MEAMLGSVGACTHVLAPPLGGCTALAVRNLADSDPGPLLAHNFDYIEAVRPYFAIRETRPANGYRSLDFSHDILINTKRPNAQILLKFGTTSPIHFQRLASPT